MALDGNLISKGAGEGEAYMFQPFQVDTHTIDQMNQNLVQQADRRIKEQQAKQAAEAQKKADFEKLLNDTYKYDPLDDVPIKKLHKEFTDLVANYKAGEDERPIKEAALALNIITNNSLNTFKKRGEIEKIRREQGDINWFVGEDEYNAGALTPNEASDLGTAAQNLQAREMALDKFQVGAPKIKNIPEFVQKTASAIPPMERKAVGQYTDASGQIQTKYENIYDPKVVDDVASVAYQTYGRDLAPVYKTEDDFKNYFKQYTNPKPTISGKFPPSNTSNKGNVGGNTVSVGNVVLNPPIKSNQAQTLLQDKAWMKYKKTFEDAQEKIDADESLTVAQKDQRKLALKKQFKPEADFKSKFSFSNNSDVVPYSVKGLPENPTHQFTTVIDGKDVQIDGQSNLFNPKANAFVVETDKGTFLAPINKNTQYLSDNGMTIEDLNKAVSKVGSGNVVTTNKEGDIVKTEKVKTFDYSKGAMQAKAKELGISVQELKNKILSKKPTATFE